MTNTNPPINYNWEFSDMEHSVYDGLTATPWWKVTLAAAKSIKTVGIINRDDCCPERISRNIVTVGNNASPNLNPACISEYVMTDGGYYMCPSPMVGTTFGIYVYGSGVFNF